MRKLFIIIIFFFPVALLTSFVFAQPTLEWARLYPDSGNIHGTGDDITVDDSGNVFITGGKGANSTGSYGTFCTIKYSPSGVIQWVANFSYDTLVGGAAFKIILDRNGNIYVTGIMHRSGILYDYCTIKYNPSGIKQWVKYFDGFAHDEDQAKAIAIDNAGNIYVAGYSSTGGGHYDYVTIKYSSVGDELWIKRYGSGASNTSLTAMVVDSLCNIYITGENGANAVTVKYDSSGNLIWAQTYAGIAGSGETGANAIAIDKDKNIYITGQSKGMVSFFDYFTVKYSASGNELWVRRFAQDSTEYSNQNYANAIAVDNTGNVIVSGTSSSNITLRRVFCIIKYTNEGSLTWTKLDTGKLGDQHSAMCLDSKNNIYVTGSYDRIRMVKYDSTGNELWNISDSEMGAFPLAITLDKYYNFYLTGGGDGNMYTLKYSQILNGITNYNNFPSNNYLEQNYPNPFNPETIIKYQIQRRSFVRLVIFDLTGREIRELVNKYQGAGNYNISWNAGALASGVYFYKLETGDFTKTKKMILIK